MPSASVRIHAAAPAALDRIVRMAENQDSEALHMHAAIVRTVAMALRFHRLPGPLSGLSRAVVGVVILRWGLPKNAGTVLMTINNQVGMVRNEKSTFILVVLLNDS